MSTPSRGPTARGLTRRAPSSPIPLLLLLVLLLLLQSSQAFAPQSFAITGRCSSSSSSSSSSTRSRRRSVTTSMTHTPQNDNDGEREQLLTRAHVLFQTAAAVTGGLLLGSATTSTSIGGVREAQAELKPIVSQTYMEQVRDAIPVKTIRGVWRIREYRDKSTGELCKGRVKMRGFVEEPNKGTLEYTGCNDSKGKGNWLLKPARIANGQIRFSARWKVRFSDGESLIYRGDVLAGGNYAKATASIVDGDILQPFTGITGNLSERKIGTFEADLIEVSDDLEKL